MRLHKHIYRSEFVRCEEPTSEGMTPAMPAATSSASRFVCVKTMVLPALAYTVRRSAKMLRLVLGCTFIARTLHISSVDVHDGKLLMMSWHVACKGELAVLYYAVLRCSAQLMQSILCRSSGGTHLPLLHACAMCCTRMQKAATVVAAVRKESMQFWAVVEGALQSTLDRRKQVG